MMILASGRSQTSLEPLATHFSQLGYVVSDLETALLSLERSWGITFSRTTAAVNPDLVRYKGKPTDVAAAMAFGQMGHIEIEIIQPLNHGNLYTDFLAERGSGLHHVGFKIPDHDRYQRYRDLLLGTGNTALQEGRFEGEINVEFCYVDCAAFGSSVIELAHFF